MTDVEDRPTRAFVRDLAAGLAAGVLVGVLLAVVVAAQGFPDWGDVVWSLALAGLVLLPVTMVVRFASNLTHESIWRETPVERRPLTKTHALQSVRVLNLVACVPLGVHLVLLVTYGLVEGRWVPSP